MNDTATRFTLVRRPIGPKPSHLRDLGESLVYYLPAAASPRRINCHSTCLSHILDWLYRIMEQPHSLTQATPPAVSIHHFDSIFTHTASFQTQTSVFINDTTHNLNGNTPHSQATGSNQSEELYKRSVMLVIWYKVSWSTSTLIPLICDHTGTYHSSSTFAPSAHLPIPSTLPVSFHPFIPLAKSKFFHRCLQCRHCPMGTTHDRNSPTCRL